MSITGRDIVAASLRLIGALAPGESLASQEATDGLASLNRLISSWSNDGLLIYAITPESPLTLTPGTATVTMGTSGNITTRPVSIEQALIRDGTSDYPVNIRSIAEYAAVRNKSLGGTYPTDLYDDGGYPLRTLTLYPVPNSAKQLVLFTERELTQVASLDTVITLPPGYERALIFNHAIDLAPEYGRSVSAEVTKGAIESLASIKRANHKPRYLKPDAIPAGTRQRFNMITGEPGR